jgi:hypothetical protein
MDLELADKVAAVAGAGKAIIAGIGRFATGRFT